MRWPAIAPRSLLALALVAVSCAVTRPIPTAPPAAAAFEVPTAVANGRITLVVERAYRIGDPVRVDAIVAPSRGRIDGPAEGRVTFSTMSSGEQVVRMLGAADITPVAVIAGSSARARVVWDGRDARGSVVAPESYQLVLTFRAVFDDREQRVEAGSVIDLRGP